MSNPFDQFGSEMQAALPPAGGDNPFANGDFGAAPPAMMEAPKPVMNNPMMPAAASPMNNGYGAAPPPQQQPMYNGMMEQQQYGMPPQQQPQGYGAPPPAYGAAPPTPQPAYGAPPASPQPAYGAPPAMNGGMAPPVPPAGGDPFAGYGAPPPPAGGGMDPYAVPPQPPMQAPPAAPPTPHSVAPSVMPTAGDPFAGYGAPPLAAGDPYGAPQPPANDPYGAPQAPPVGAGDPFGAPQPPPPANDPYGVPQQQPPPATDPYGAPQPPVAAAPPAGDPFGGGYGMPPAAPVAPAADPFGGYGAPPGQHAPPPTDPYAAHPPPQQQQYPPAAPAAADPFGGYGAPPLDPNMGALVPSQQPHQPYAHLVPPQQQQQQQAYPPQQQAPPPVDPFSVFNSAPAPPPPAPVVEQQLVPAQAPPQSQALVPAAAPAQSTEDLFADMGFDSPTPAAPAPAADNAGPTPATNTAAGELPPGGEFYDARIFTPTLGVMFFKPQELTDSLFLNTERELVDALEERPVVAFIVEGSSARSAGVELGHVLLKVNGVDVRNPKEASRLIKEGPRPLPLLFYVPSTDVVVAEGEHMVKYDTRETTAPNSAKDWKPKYVVIGGIIAQPWMMNMYRSKSEYDIAVIETQARRPVSVKVKQFSMQGARIQNDWQGPQMVKYKNKLHPWKYIVVLPVARNPIKISSPNLAQLKPVHEGIRRVLLAAQRERGGRGRHRDHHSAAPHSRGDPYGGQQQQHAPPPQQHHAPPPQQYAQPPPQQYAQQPQYAAQPYGGGY